MHGIEKDYIHEICLNADFKDKFNSGGVRMIHGAWEGLKELAYGRNSVRNSPDDETNTADNLNVVYVCGRDKNLTRLEFLA